MTEVPPCLNCQTPLLGPFCAACGQRAVDLDRGLLEVAGEMLGEAFEADGRLFATARPFVLEPGRLTADWMEGKRARYTSPARIFVFALFVGFVGLAIAADRSVALVPDASLEVAEDGVVRIGSEEDNSSLHITWDADDELATRFSNQREVAEVLVREMLEQGSAVVVALVPVLAMLLTVVLWRERVLRHLVFSLNLHSRLLIFGGIALVLPTSWPMVFVLLAMQAYLLLGLRTAYSLSWRGAIGRYLVVAAAYAVCWSVGVIALAVYAASRSLGG